VFAGPSATADPPATAGGIAIAAPVPRMGEAKTSGPPSETKPAQDEPAAPEPERIPSARDLQVHGGFLVLQDAEDEVSNGIPQLRKLRDAYEAAVKWGNSLEKEWTAALDAREPLVRRREDVRQRIDEHVRRVGPALQKDAVVKKAYGELLRQLTDLDGQIDKYPPPEEIDRKRRQSKEEIEGRRAAFAERVTAVRALVDRTRRAYATLADDPEVVRIQQALRTSKPIKFGPSPGFFSRVEELEAIEKTLSGAGSRAIRKSRRR
jgi:hypothetical protein